MIGVRDVPMNEHVKWVAKQYYHNCYPNMKPDAKSGIARLVHGVQHAVRVAVYVCIFANLYRKYKDADALALTNEDLLLLQIAALFHDVERRNEGEDLWDCESATACYLYLTVTLNVDKQKAKLIAEAIANKDVPKKFKHMEELREVSYGIAWRTSATAPERNIYQKLIHDADCADIMRACDFFKGSELDFYQDFACKDKNISKDLGRVLAKVASLIAFQGDTYRHMKKDIKKKYEHADDCYAATVNDINDPTKQLEPLKIFFANGTLQESFAEIPDDFLRQHDVLFRAVLRPLVAEKPNKNGEVKSFTEKEIEKVMRRPGVPTSSSKPDRLNKNGNPARSMSYIAYGAVPIGPVGYACYDIDVKHIRAVSGKDCDSGYGKKIDLFKNDVINCAKSVVEAFEELKERIKYQPCDGAVFKEWVIKNNECIVDIEQFNMVWFTADPTVYSLNMGANKSALILLSLYLQEVYFVKSKKLIPIYQYSYLHDTFKPIKFYTEDEIIQLWRDAAVYYLKKLFSFMQKELLTCSFASFKENIIPWASHECYAKDDVNVSVDKYYSDLLRVRVDTLLVELLSNVKLRAVKLILDNIKQKKPVTLSVAHVAILNQKQISDVYVNAILAYLKCRLASHELNLTMPDKKELKYIFSIYHHVAPERYDQYKKNVFKLFLLFLEPWQRVGFFVTASAVLSKRNEMIDVVEYWQHFQRDAYQMDLSDASSIVNVLRLVKKDNISPDFLLLFEVRLNNLLHENVNIVIEASKLRSSESAGYIVASGILLENYIKCIIFSGDFAFAVICINKLWKGFISNVWTESMYNHFLELFIFSGLVNDDDLVLRLIDTARLHVVDYILPLKFHIDFYDRLKKALPNQCFTGRQIKAVVDVLNDMSGKFEASILNQQPLDSFLQKYPVPFWDVLICGKMLESYFVNHKKMSSTDKSRLIRQLPNKHLVYPTLEWQKMVSDMHALCLKVFNVEMSIEVEADARAEYRNLSEVMLFQGLSPKNIMLNEAPHFISEKMMIMMEEVQRKEIKVNSKEAYVVIRDHFDNYSRANAGNWIFAAFTRFFIVDTDNTYAAIVAKLLSQPQYSEFNQAQLSLFLAELKQVMRSNPDEDMNAIFFLIKRLTGINFDTIVADCSGSSSLRGAQFALRQSSLRL